MKFALFDFSVEPVLPEHLEDASYMRDMLINVLGMDNDIIENTDAYLVEVFPQNPIHKPLKTCWGVCQTHGTH